MQTKTKTQTVEGNGNGTRTLSPADVARLFADGYREVEILPDGRVREASSNGHDAEETVTRTLKTQRTWY
jgi:hypothetical protein